MQDLFFPCPLYQIKVAQPAIRHQKGVMLVIETKTASTAFYLKITMELLKIPYIEYLNVFINII